MNPTGSTQTSNLIRQRSATVCLSIAIIACALCFIPRMLNGKLRNWDEAWYAQVSRETSAQDNWLTLRWNDHPWFEKPPLTFWITGTFFRIFGESEITARLLSVLCGVGLCVVVFVWLKDDRGPIAALIAVLLLLSIPDFSRYVARGQMDAPITLLIAISLLAYRRAWTNPNWLWLCNAAVGIGFMTKGSVAAFTWIILVCHACLTRRLQLLFGKPFLFSTFFAITIALPWHAYQASQHGSAFLTEYFGRHIGQLFTLPDVATEPTAPVPYEPFFYVRYMLTKFAVWGWMALGIFIASVVLAFKRPDERRLLLICWFFAVLAVLSLSKMKRGWYLFLLYPPIAILAVECAASFNLSRLFRFRTAMVAGICALITLGTDLARPPSKEFESEIASLAFATQDILPDSQELCTLQTEISKESIYPISARYYFNRHVRIVVSIEQMVQMIANEEKLRFVLLTSQSELRLLQWSESKGERLTSETLAQRGDVKLVRIATAWNTAKLQQTFQ